jgi:hypothetical protein
VVVDCLYLFYCHPLPCLGVERGIDRPAPPGASPRGEPRRRHAQGGGGARVHAPRRTSGQREDAAHPYAPERMWTICVKRLWACCCGSAAPPPAGGCTAAASAAASIPPARRAPQGHDQDTTASDCQRLRSRAHREWGNIQVCAQPRPGGRAARTGRLSLSEEASRAGEASVKKSLFQIRDWRVSVFPLQSRIWTLQTVATCTLRDRYVY